ncbi:MAG: hypothetical protein IJ255_05870 [Bacteroidales bacterium]|nr:hypothetical protein [Bacteroidales bacterium]
MKKVFYILGILSLGLLASCQKEEIGGTSMEAMAGEWVIEAYDAVDASGKVLYEDPYGGVDSRIWTYNTADDNGTDLFITDNENGGDYRFWEYKCKVTADPATLTFSGMGVTDQLNGVKVDITDGKITLGAAKTPSGMPADKIEFYVVFEDDDNAGKFWNKLYVHGYRYTGFDADGI